MLVLSRKTGEKVVITGPCTIQIAQVMNGRVRLAFDAPLTTNVVRDELLADDEDRPKKSA